MRQREVTLYLDVEQPCLQISHSFLSQSQIPQHQVQSLIGEETLVHCGHTGLATDLPHVEGQGFLL